MSSKDKNLSTFSNEIPSGKGKTVAIVRALWNIEVTQKLLDGCVATLLENDVDKDDILVSDVPGTFELTLGALRYAKEDDVDAVICIGVVVQGETPHFDFICQGVSYGITELNIEYEKPIIFGVLTTLDNEQALDRAGGKHGNKGVEAAHTALQML